MAKNDSKREFTAPRYQYGAIERALATTFGADLATQVGPLRGRLKRLGTLGLPTTGPGPGKGRRRLYSWEESLQLLLALLLADIGIDPVVIAAAIRNTWSGLATSMADATNEAALAGNPSMLTVRLEAIGGPWRTGHPLSAAEWISIAPRIDVRSRQKYLAEFGMTEELATVRADNSLMMLNRDMPGWLATRNLTTVVSKFQTALHS